MATAIPMERVEFAHRRTVKDGQAVKELVSKTEIRDEQNKIKIVTIGTANDRKTASILLVGETGAGKTTSLNALINVLIGVQFEDDFRYAVVDEMEAEKKVTGSQTEFVTGYLLYHKPGMPYECNFLIFDTPGLLDTKMKEQKRKIREQMELFLGKREFDYLKGNAFSVSCLGFVMKSSTNRTGNYVKEFITELETLFSRDTLSITNILATFCGIDESCLSLRRVLQDFDVKYRDLFPIENHNIFSQNNPHAREFWEVTVAQYRRLIENIAGRSTELHLTEALNKQRLCLRADESKLKELINTYVKDLLKLGKNEESHKKFLDIKKRSNFNCRRKVQTKTRVALASGYHAHNCRICEKSCFSDCYHTWGMFSFRCPPSSGKCQKCSCNLSEHREENKEIVVSTEEENYIDKEKKIDFDNAERELHRIDQENKEIKSRNIKVEIQRMIGRISDKREFVGSNMRLGTTQTGEECLKQLIEEVRKDMLKRGTCQSDKTLIANAMQELHLG